MLPDPQFSLDPAIRTVVARRTALAVEGQRIDGILVDYLSYRTRPVPAQPAISALDHYSILENSTCGCGTCAEWDMRRAEFIAAARLVPKGHKWTTCTCKLCRFVGRIQLNFLAATNRRDLLIETSYHARYHSPYGTQVMRWLEIEMQRPIYTVNWCAQEMSRYPLEWWLRRCEGAVGPQVSGVVFRASMMVTDMEVHFPSTLTAMGEYSFA